MTSSETATCYANTETKPATRHLAILPRWTRPALLIHVSEPRAPECEHPLQNTDRDTDADADTDRVRDRDPDRDPEKDPDTDLDATPDPDADPDAYAYADSDVRWEAVCTDEKACECCAPY